MILPVTLTIAAAAAVLNLWLALRVSRVRIRDKVSVGDGGLEPMTAKMRAHANFAEYAPIVLILLALVEFAGGSPAVLWGLGAAFILARIAHGFGMDRPAPNPFRAGGAAVTWIVTAGLAGWALAMAYGAWTPQTPRSAIELTPARG